MKVLHLGKFDRFGGIERHVRLLLTGLTETGEVTAVNLVSNDAATTNEDMRYGYKTVRAACWGSVASVALTPSLPLLARRLHAQYEFDVVHMHFPDPLGQLTASLLPRAVARVVSWHSDIVRQQIGLALYRPFLARFLGTVDTVIAATPYHFTSSNQIPPELTGLRRAVIPYAFEPERWRITPVSAARLKQLQEEKGTRPAVFALGRHVYYKGFDVLIRAMHEVDALLWIGGTGPLTAEWQALVASEGLAHRVRFAGSISEEELPAYYQACDVFCLPSVEKSEAFGLVQLEAMFFRRPIVSTRLGTGVDWVNRDGESGLQVAPRDIPALAAAINQLLRSPDLRATMGEAGHQRVLSDFSRANMVTQTLGVYREAIVLHARGAKLAQ